MCSSRINRLITFGLIQLVFLFSVQHYFSEIKETEKSICVLQKALPSATDYNAVPEADELIVEKDKGDERSELLLATFQCSTSEFFPSPFIFYGIHSEPSSNYSTPVYLRVRTLLI